MNDTRLQYHYYYYYIQNGTLDVTGTRNERNKTVICRIVGVDRFYYAIVYTHTHTHFIIKTLKYDNIFFVVFFLVLDWGKKKFSQSRVYYFTQINSVHSVRRAHCSGVTSHSRRETKVKYKLEVLLII